jgi:hypothetical protein
MRPIPNSLVERFIVTLIAITFVTTTIIIKSNKRLDAVKHGVGRAQLWEREEVGNPIKIHRINY